METSQLELDIEQVESLIIQLYQPNPPEVISRVQATLSQLQTLPTAWAMTSSLLESKNEKVRFFGILTIIIKLNNETASLSDKEATELLVKLIGWYLESIVSTNNRLVSRKLVAAFATFYLRFSHLWPHFPKHLAFCLARNLPCEPESMDEHSNLDTILQSLGDSGLQPVLLVATAILEDVSRLDLSSSTNSEIYASTVQNMPDIICLVERCLHNSNMHTSTADDAMKCLQACISLSQRLSTRDYHITDSLKPLVVATINAVPNESVFDTAVELLTDLLTNYPSLLTSEHYQMLSNLLQSPWSDNLYRRLIAGDFAFECIQFGSLLLAFADSKVEYLLKTSHRESRDLLFLLCNLLSAEGYPAIEDRIFVPTIEFWSTFAESIPDHMSVEGTQQEEWVASSISIVVNVCSLAWPRIIFPLNGEALQWDFHERASFNDARKDVVDFLQSVYALIGPELLNVFVDAALQSIPEANWQKLEASVYCLAGLSESCKEDERCDPILNKLFCSNFFSITKDNIGLIPSKTRQTSLSFVELYADYFERNLTLLYPVLEFCFSNLYDGCVSAAASKSIFRLSSSCRHQLHEQVGLLLEEYLRIANQVHLDCPSTEKIMGAFACIAQGIPSSQSKNKYLICNQLLGFVERELDNFKSMPYDSQSKDKLCPDSEPDENPSLHAAIRALRCLASIGKGFQVPYDTPVDIDAKQISPRPMDETSLSEVQKKIVDLMLAIQQTFNKSPYVTELICSILRSGFSETTPGPFVLPPREVAQYITGHTYDTPRIGLMVGMACSFMSSLRRLPIEIELLETLLSWVISLLQRIPELEYEAELVQSVMEFATRLLAQQAPCLLCSHNTEAVEYFFLVSIQVLDGKEPLPKAAAAEFWSAFVSFRTSETSLQNSFQAAMDVLGPLLCQSLMRNIGGNASRSELDRLSEPLKKLVSRHSKAKEWLTAAMNHASFPSSKATPDQKILFIKKAISLRGSRLTNQLVRDFWLSCRGSSFAYVS